jgi:hypothetical protein
MALSAREKTLKGDRQGWPSFWRDRAKPFDSTVENLQSCLEAGLKEIGDLEALGSFQDRLDEQEEALPSEEARAKRLAIHHAYYASQTIASLCAACGQHWRRGDFISFSLIGRLIFEYPAALHYSLKFLKEGSASSDWKRVNDGYGALVLGTRRPFWLKVYDIERPSSINILTQIKHWTAENPEAVDEYAFLSETCHPNHLQHYYYYKAGAAGDLYTSLMTEAEIDEALERTVSILEKVAKSIGASLLEIAQIARPTADI